MGVGAGAVGDREQDGGSVEGLEGANARVNAFGVKSGLLCMLL
jgi:hypothetical protein